MTDILSLTAHRAALTAHGQTKRRTLASLEAVVVKHLKGFIEAGDALGEIRRGQLWKDERPGKGEPYYRTWDDYLDRRWFISRAHACRLEKGSQAAGRLLPTGNMPTNERQVRPLVGLPAGVAQSAWDRATEGGRQPTAEEVQRAADESLAEASLGELTLRLSTEDALKAKKKSIDTAEAAAHAAIALEPELKRLALIEKLGTRMLRLMAGDEDATSLQKGAMALASGKGGKRLHAAAELARQALKVGKKKAG